MATAPDCYIWSSDVQTSVPKGFVVCMVWFVPAGAESMSFFKNKSKTKIVPLKIIIIFFKPLSTYLVGCFLSVMSRTSILVSGLVYIGTLTKQC